MVIPGEKLSDVCKVVHALGIHGLTDFLPNNSGSVGNGGGEKAQPKFQILSNMARSQPVMSMHFGNYKSNVTYSLCFISSPRHLAHQFKSKSL